MPKAEAPERPNDYYYELEGFDKEATEEMVFSILENLGKESLSSDTDVQELVSLCQGLPLIIL